MTKQEIVQPSIDKPQFFYGYIVVIAALFTMVLMFGVYNSFGVFFKPLLTEFGWTRAMTSAAFSLSWIIQGLLAVIMGRLTDRLGPRIVMTICGFFLGLGYLLMSQVVAIWQFYLFYGVIIGLGMAGSWVPLVSLAARWFLKRRSMATGIIISGIGIGTLIGPPLAEFLISIYDWRQSYLILGITVLILVVSAAQFMKRDPAQIGQSPYGENAGEEQELELATDSLTPKEAIATRQFWLVMGMVFCEGFCIFVIIVHIVPHATGIGISATSAARILAAVGGLSIAGKIVMGFAADRIGSKQSFIIGFILMSAALFWLPSIKELWLIYVFTVVFAFGYGSCSVSQPPLVAMLFGLSSHGAIMGVVTFGFSIGAAVGPLIAGYIFDISGSYQVAFWASAATGVIGLILIILITPGKTK